ncbi:cysteine proteinase [Metschnikowia bicuspidata]|uniref:Cysteine proteinase n=1 Tax=Metschnikowia bicuspidata TaxID=27322 RepID=A0A4P9ZAQ6_9ASCO|nr:cysteine proteinase [Metschnikowia bicuspidata]
MLNLFRLSTEAPEQVSECADASAVPQVEPANTTANTPLDGASAAWTAQKSPDVLPRELVGLSMSQNNYSNLYESMFEVDSDDEMIDLNAQYGSSLRISEDSHRKPGLFGTASFTLPADDMLDGIDLSAADEYDKAVSKFYMPLKPVPRKPFSLTEVIMASIPAPSLTSFLRRERAHIQDLILNERKAKLARITPLPPQQLQVVNRYWQMRQASAPVVSAYSIDITVRDLSTLADGRWLNDNVIDFYLNMVAERYPDVYCWTTHFFTTLKSKGYAGVARWAKRRKVTLTDKKLIAVPINIMSTHWAMAVVDNEAETISYYDSLASKGNLNAVQLLQHYMAKECERLQVAPVWYTLQPHMETPQQLNGFDCGVFSCSVAKFVCGRMALSFSQSDMATLRRRMAFEIILKSLLEDTPRAHL